MNTEDAWKNWWDSEGRNMERLPHHDAVDHLASMTRIAWLNGAFGAADEIERLREQLRLANIDNFNTTAEIERLRVIVQGWEHSARNAERDITELRAERDGARAEVCLLRTATSAAADTVNQSMADYAESRGWKDLFREDA